MAGRHQQDRSERLTALFDAHAAALHRYARRRGASTSDADDHVAETFLHAWRRLDDIPAGYELAWLYRTCANVMANHRRRHQPVPADPFAPDSPATPPGTSDGADPTADTVTGRLASTAAWQSLTDHDREILRLAAWEGLRGRALAEATGVSETAAASALHRARARLAGSQQEHGSDEDGSQNS